MTGWNQSKHGDQVAPTKESSCPIIDDGGNVSIVISQKDKCAISTTTMLKCKIII